MSGSWLVARDDLAGRLFKRDACAGQVKTGAYDLSLHIGALFIILGVSGGACAIPQLISRFPIPYFFFAVRHFGTGVLLATAFVHLLPTAFLSLSNPCLPKFWTEDYPPMPGAIALAGVLVVAVVEMILSPARHFVPPQRGRLASVDVAVVDRASLEVLDSDQTVANLSLASASPSPSPTPSPVEKQLILTPEQERKKSMLQCVMLEVGILFHSVFIGMALSVSTGGDFVVLLIAISFHREWARAEFLTDNDRDVRRSGSRVADSGYRLACAVAASVVHGSGLRLHVS